MSVERAKEAQLILVREAEELRDLIIGYEVCRQQLTAAEGGVLEKMLFSIYSKAFILRSGAFVAMYFSKRGSSDYLVSCLKVFKLIEDEVKIMIDYKEVFLEIPFFVTYITLLNDVAVVGNAISSADTTHLEQKEVVESAE